MEEKASELKLAEEMEKLVSRRKAYDNAHSALLSELERDSLRGEGSMAQERRREEHQNSLREQCNDTEKALEEQKRIMSELINKF